MTRFGTPCSLYIWGTNICASFLADGKPLQGTKCACLENKSMTVHITVCPLLGGRSTIKSIAMSSQGASGLATDCKSPYGLPGFGFAITQVGHPCTYVLMSVHILGHQNCLRVRCNVLRNPKWPAVLASWHCSRTFDRSVVGTYNQSPRHARLS